MIMNEPINRTSFHSGYIEVSKGVWEKPRHVDPARLHTGHAQRSQGHSLEIKQSSDVAVLNKTEQAYLDFLKSENHDWIGVQNITIKLAHDCRLTCDFIVLDQGRLRFIDVKGFQREDALIKMKVAARMFPWAEFQIVKRLGAAWEVRNVKA